jgi:hypothetical protein
MERRCLERERLVAAATIAIEGTQAAIRDRITARNNNSGIDARTIVLFDARAAERSAMFALDYHQQAHSCEAKIYVWSIFEMWRLNGDLP